MLTGSGQPLPGLTVSPQEAGMKLLRFLERRLLEVPPKSILHRWIRTGQVRINGSRAKPFTLLAEGDKVRIPPFAPARDTGEKHTPEVLSQRLGPGLKVLDISPELIVLAKPGGLPCQPGSGHADSVSARLTNVFSDFPFIPAPAHRLDRQTSGLLLAARTHAAQKELHTLFRDGGIGKEYLAWVKGEWPHAYPYLLRDTLGLERDGRGSERIYALPGGSCHEMQDGHITDKLDELARPERAPGSDSATALCIVLLVQSALLDASGSAANNRSTPKKLTRLPTAAAISTGQAGRASLLLVRLLTGRKHQIRVQLSSRGFPIIGDRRYGGMPFPQLLLHAYALTLPPSPDGIARHMEYSLLPDWPRSFIPSPERLTRARAAMK